MLSRLHLGAADPEATLLTGLPVPRGEGPLSLLQALAQALEYTGVAEAFPSLMVVSGEAFSVAAPRCVGAVSAVLPDLQGALAALGFRQARVRSAAEGLLPEEILEVVAAETAAGRPAVLGGWPPAAPGWALLAGRASGGLVCGYDPLSAPGDPYLAAPAQGDLLIALGPRGAVAPGALLPAATAAARDRWETTRPGCSALYRTWLHLLSDQGGPTAPVATEAAIALAALVEARAAARDFLEAQLDDLPPLAAAWAERAANAYEYLLDLAEPLSAALTAPGRDILWAEPEWRSESHERLEQIAELDAEAVNSLRRIAEADYSPDEM